VRQIREAVAGTIVGVGQIFDVLQHNAETTYIVYSDIYNNLFIVKAARQNSNFDFQRRFLGKGCQSVAITSHKNNLIIAFVRNINQSSNTVQTGFFTVSHDLSSQTFDTHFQNPETITSATFIKNAPRPMLILANSNRSFLRTTEDAEEGRGAVRINVTVNIL